MNVLITGSSGFLGQYLIKYAPHSFHVTAHYFKNPPQDFGQEINKVSMDLTGFIWKELQELHPDVIIHTAAMASIDDCEDYPQLASLINYDATCQLSDFSEKLNSRLIFISSDVVFDGFKGDYREEDQPRPVNVYAETKRKSEKYILHNCSNAVVIRPALFYGVALGGRQSFTETMLAQLRTGNNVKTFIDQYRTPIFVHDLAQAIWELADHDYKGILHLGGPEKVNRYEVGLMLCNLFKLNKDLLIPVKSADVKMKAPRPADCSLNISRAQGILDTLILDCHNGLARAYRS